MATTRGNIVTAAVAALAGASAFSVNGAAERRSELPSFESLEDGPVVLVSDPESQQAQAAYGNHAWPLTLRVEVIAKIVKAADETLTPTMETLRGYAAAALAALGADTTLAGLVEDLRPAAVRINPGQPGDAVASVQVDLAVTYEAALWAL